MGVPVEADSVCGSDNGGFLRFSVNERDDGTLHGLVSKVDAET